MSTSYAYDVRFSNCRRELVANCVIHTADTTRPESPDRQLRRVGDVYWAYDELRLSTWLYFVSRPPKIEHSSKGVGIKWTNKSETIDEMAVTLETGGRIFVDPAGNLVVKIVNKYDESAYRYTDRDLTTRTMGRAEPDVRPPVAASPSAKSI